MVAACIGSRWTGADGAILDSFALIIDEPPLEVAAAGHDRRSGPLRAQRINAWLNPTPGDYGAMQAILEDRERSHNEHRFAA